MNQRNIPGIDYFAKCVRCMRMSFKKKEVGEGMGRLTFGNGVSSRKACRRPLLMCTNSPGSKVKTLGQKFSWRN